MNVRILIVVAVSGLLTGCGTAPPIPSATTPGVSPPSETGTAHFDMSGLAFDYPAAWQSISVDRILHYETVVAFLTSGTATASETCGPGYVPGLGGDCSQDITMPPNSVVVRISLWDGPPALPAGAIAALRTQGWSALTIAGEPAAFTPQALEGIPGSDRSLVWAVAAPGTDTQKAYWITAGLRGPDVAAIQAQVETMVATIHFTAVEPNGCRGPVGSAVPACSPVPTAPPSGFGEAVSIPTAPSPAAGQLDLCPAAALTPFTLAGDPTKSPAVWGINSVGDVFPITWPAGFTARFSPDLQIVDRSGAVVARGGVLITDAGGGNDGNGGSGAYICILNGKTY